MSGYVSHFLTQKVFRRKVLMVRMMFEILGE